MSLDLNRKEKIRTQVVVLKTGEVIRPTDIILTKSKKNCRLIFGTCNCSEDECYCTTEKRVAVNDIATINGKEMDPEIILKANKPNIKGLKASKLNTELQYYRGLPLRLIARKDYNAYKAKRFVINDTNQNVWIPNPYLEPDGTIKEGVDLMFVFRKAKHQLALAGYKIK